MGAGRSAAGASLHTGEMQVLEMVASGAPLSAVLDTLVRVIEGSANGMRGSVLLLEDGVRVRHGAAPSLPVEYIGAIDGEPIGPQAGSCGTAAYRRQAVIVEDIAIDPLWEPYRTVALAHGLRACWSIPIFGSGDAVLGTFALYYGEPRAPTPELLDLAKRATHLAAVAIERHLHEMALVESEERARAIVDNALDANIIIDADGRVVGWGERAVEVFGWKSDEAVGHRLSALIIPEYMRAQHEAGLERFRATSEGPLLGRRVEVTAIDSTGREFPVELAVTKIKIANGVYFSAFVRDITSRKRAEQALRDSEQHLSLVYEHVADVLFSISVEPDGEYRFLSLNPSFYRATGLRPDQVVGKRVSEIIPEPSWSIVRAKYDEAIRTKKTVRWDETTPYPSGTRHGEVAVTPVFDANGRARSIIGSVRDVTERRQLEEEMRQLQKLDAIGRLTAGIAHDFNNILGIILMRASMVLEGLTNADDREQLREIINAGERGAGLTRQFLAFSRKQILKPDVIDLNELVTNVRTMVRPLIGGGVDLSTVLEPELWRVEADPGQMEQVLMNLVINAKDAMPAGGKLTIATGNATVTPDVAKLHADVDPGEYVSLAVIDSGTGMDDATRQRIFEPFFTTKDPGRGTGLGLATVYGIVKQSRGNIRVDSTPGVGTSFTIYLPRTTAQPLPRASRPVPRSSGRVVLGHVLVVEDEPGLRDTLERLLPKLKCRVTATASAEEALALVSGGAQFDMVITDIVMPGMNGRDLVERLRHTQPTLKALFVSGYPDAALREGVAEGESFLQKPFSISDLSRRLEQALDVA